MQQLKRSNGEAAINAHDSIKWEAAKWVARRMGEGPFDEPDFDAWIARDPRHRSAFDAMWRRIMGVEMGAALHGYGQRKAGRRTALASVTAALLVVAGGYTAVPFVELQFASAQEFAAADGTVREIGLADGSRITLGGGSHAKVRYTRHDRVIELNQGAMFAEVVHDADRPFRIETGNAEIVDIGTSFEVVSKPSNVRVTVAEGIVQVALRGWFHPSVRLGANEAALLGLAGVSKLANVSAGNVAPWRGEWVEYKGRPLREVIADLRSLAPVPIEIARQQLGDQPVSGRIRLTDPMGQLENLSIIHGFNIRKSSKRIVIY